MITEYFTPDEITTAVAKIYLQLWGKVRPEHDRLKKEFMKRRNSLKYPFVFAKTQTVTHDGNTYVVVYGSPNKKVDNFGCQLFLVLNTSTGKRYYRLLTSGVPQVVTKHFMERFIERSEYPVSKENFLLYLSKDMNYINPSVMGEQGKLYMLTESGLVVCTESALITYINRNDLSSYKDEIGGELEDVLNQMTQADILDRFKSNVINMLAKVRNN